MATVKFETYRADDGWRIRATHRNKKILIVSSEAYKRKFDANRMLTNLLLAIQKGDFKREPEVKP